MTTMLSPEALQKAEDGATILSGLSHALDHAGASSYADQVRLAAEAVSAIISEHPQSHSDPLWSAIAAGEHRDEIILHFSPH